MKKKIIPLLLMFIAFTFSAKAFAHPHVRMYAKLEFEFYEQRCRGFWVEWSFDDYFGTRVIREFDKDKDGTFNEREIKNIYSRAFINLRNYGFFVFIRKGNIRNHPLGVEHFKAIQKKGQLFYRFFVPLKGDMGGDFSIAIFDRTYYCDIRYAAHAVVIRQKSGEKPTFEISTNKHYPVYYNPLGAADDMRIYKKWKPGLETAYPDEVRVYFKGR